MSDYTEGTTTKGTVSQLNSAGAVIKLEESVEGLIPVKEYPETIKTGDEVDVLVKKTLMRERRFILALKK